MQPIVKKVFTVSLLILVLLLWRVKTYSQKEENQQAIAILKKLADRYRHAGKLSFDMRFRYSSDKKPEYSLDSLSGNFKMNDSLYWYSLDNTECAFNNTALVMLFKEDKIIYLCKPLRTEQSSSPVVMIDSLLNGKKNISCSISNGNGYTKISIASSAGYNWKKVEFVIDSSSGFLKSMQTWVKSAELYDPSIKGLVDKESYAIISTDYYHYQQGEFDNSIFDINSYCKKSEGQYVAVKPFESYKIFIGSPNL
jgi:hypothetical protein